MAAQLSIVIPRQRTFSCFKSSKGKRMKKKTTEKRAAKMRMRKNSTVIKRKSKRS
jgi:hypothetical protein